MSTIGSTSPAGLNLAGSVAGTIRADSAVDQNKAASAEQKANLDRRDALTQTLGDIADPDFGSDRDADGRLPYHRSAAADVPSEPDEHSTGAATRRRAPTADPFGDRGNSLDVEA